jgi:hypothetical protein
VSYEAHVPDYPCTIFASCRFSLVNGDRSPYVVGMDKEKDPAAVALGRKGGLAGRGASQKRSAAFYKKQGKARAEKRWAKVRALAAEPNTTDDGVICTPEMSTK